MIVEEKKDTEKEAAMVWGGSSPQAKDVQIRSCNYPLVPSLIFPIHITHFIYVSQCI